MVSAEENRWLIDLYEEEIAHTDREIGRLLDAVEKSGRADRTLIIVVADHGEEFLDHGSYGHTSTLWQEQLHVPLLVVPPGSTRSTRIDGVVETRTVFGTVLDVLGLDFAKAARARSLLAHVSPEGTEVVDPNAKAFSITWLPDSEVAWGKRMCVSSLREGRWKLVRHYTWEKTMLFDLDADPKELRDLSEAEPERTAAMAATLEAWTDEQKNRGSARKVQLDAEETRKLKELGYL
jgi:arylsulfatase A-like enzyme